MQNSLYTSNFNKFKRVISIIIFIALLFTGINIASGVLSLKAHDGITTWNTFYDIEKDTLDVLVIGSSRVYVNINPVVLYDTEGIAAYNLCGSMQPMWNSYYYFKEALKYQKPKLLILDGYYTSETLEYGSQERIIKNNYGMKWSLLKVQSILTSAPKDEWGDYLIGLIQYHNRYESLSRADFTEAGQYPDGKTWRGQADNYNVEVQTYPDIHSSINRGQLNEKSEEYYRKILQLAKDEGIPVCVIIPPYQNINGAEVSCFNTASDIAMEYGAEFIDLSYKYDEIGLDLYTDYADMVHMNYLGNEKFSKYLAGYLKERYELPDRRGDETYSDWEQESFVRAHKINNNKISTTRSVSEYKVVLSDESHNADYIYMYNRVNYGSVSNVYVYDGGKLIYSSENTDEEFYMAVDDWNCLRSDQWHNMYYNNSVYSKVNNGYNILVYDKVTETIIDCIGIGFNNDGTLKDTIVR